jgi:hypothetical protein
MRRHSKRLCLETARDCRNKVQLNCLDPLIFDVTTLLFRKRLCKLYLETVCNCWGRTQLLAYVLLYTYRRTEVQVHARQSAAPARPQHYEIINNMPATILSLLLSYYYYIEYIWIIIRDWVGLYLELDINLVGQSERDSGCICPACID